MARLSWMAAPLLLLAVPDVIPAEEPPEDVENIRVTAERRENEADRVPIALTVATDAALDASGIESTLDLPLRTPGLVFSTSSVLGLPTLRGVGSDLLSAGADASVATFVDGVYQSRAVAALQDFYDVERIEVLKGPQGTLFGRNAAAGVIHVVNRRPEAELGAHADLLYGNYDKLRFRGALNAPIVNDRVIARISGLRSQRDGFVENPLLGRDLDDEDYGAVRGQLLGVLSDDVSLLLRADSARERSTRGLAPKVGEPFPANSGVAAGALVPASRTVVLNDTANRASVDAWGTSAELDWELPLAHMESLTAFRRTRFSQVLDFEGTEIPAFVAAPDEESGTVSQELQWTSASDGPLEWLAGLFYLHEEATQRVDLNAILFGQRDFTDADLRADALAAYGQGTLALSDAWRLTAGLRYSYEVRSEDFAEFVNGAPVAYFDEREDWDAWSPRFVVEYAPEETLLAYASVSRGFKSGGFNSTVAQVQPSIPSTSGPTKAASSHPGRAGGRGFAPRCSTTTTTTSSCRCSDRGSPFPRS